MDNKLQQFQPLETLGPVQYTIESFDLGGEQNVIVDVQSLRK